MTRTSWRTVEDIVTEWRAAGEPTEVHHDVYSEVYKMVIPIRTVISVNDTTREAVVASREGAEFTISYDVQYALHVD